MPRLPLVAKPQPVLLLTAVAAETVKFPALSMSAVARYVPAEVRALPAVRALGFENVRGTLVCSSTCRGQSASEHCTPRSSLDVADTFGVTACERAPHCTARKEDFWAGYDA